MVMLETVLPDTLVKFRSTLKILIKDSKRSRESIATDLGVTRGTLKNYLSGKSLPPGDVIVKISLLFKISTDNLLGLATDQSFEISNLGLELALMLDKIEPEMQDICVDLFSNTIAVIDRQAHRLRINRSNVPRNETKIIVQQRFLAKRK